MTGISPHSITFLAKAVVIVEVAELVVVVVVVIIVYRSGVGVGHSIHQDS